MNMLEALYMKDKREAWTCLITDERYSNDWNLLTFVGLSLYTKTYTGDNPKPHKFACEKRCAFQHFSALFMKSGAFHYAFQRLSHERPFCKEL